MITWLPFVVMRLLQISSPSRKGGDTSSPLPMETSGSKQDQSFLFTFCCFSTLHLCLRRHMSPFWDSNQHCFLSFLRYSLYIQAAQRAYLSGIQVASLHRSYIQISSTSHAHLGHSLVLILQPAAFPPCCGRRGAAGWMIFRNFFE